MAKVPIRNLGVGVANPDIKYITKGNSIKTESTNLNIESDHIYFSYPNQATLLNVDLTNYNTLKVTNRNDATNGDMLAYIDSTNIGRGHLGQGIATDSFNVSSYSGVHTIGFTNSSAYRVLIYSVFLEK